MAELPADRAGQIKIKEVSLAKNRFDVAAENIKDEHVSQEMPRTVVKKNGGDELPGIGVVHAAVAEGEIIGNETRPIIFQKKLHKERSCIRTN